MAGIDDTSNLARRIRERDELIAEVENEMIDWYRQNRSHNNSLVYGGSEQETSRDIIMADAAQLHALATMVLALRAGV